eukprot:Mrub_03901.p1 GENE.Mrub_03901~~Mrub_03901.p1  ORF type:complete len:405 (-),score=63.23 Mrub_03901:152-1297(-)
MEEKLLIYTNTANSSLISYLKVTFNCDFDNLIAFIEAHPNQFVTYYCLTFLKLNSSKYFDQIYIDFKKSTLQSGDIDLNKLLKFMMIQKIVMRRKELFTCASEYLKYTMIFAGINYYKTVEDINLHNHQDINHQVNQESINKKLILKNYSKNEFFIDLNFGSFTKYYWLKNNRALYKNISMVNLTQRQFTILMNNITPDQVSFYKELCAKYIENFCEWFENHDFDKMDDLYFTVLIIDSYLTEKNTPYFLSLLSGTYRYLGTFLHTLCSNAQYYAYVRHYLSQVYEHALRAVHCLNYPLDANLLDLWRTMLADAQQLDHHVRKRSVDAATVNCTHYEDKQVGVDMDVNTSSLHIEFDTTDEELTDVECQFKTKYVVKSGKK